MILLAIDRKGMIYPFLKWHRIIVTTLVKSKDYLNSQNCKTFPTRSQFPYECLNYPYCVSFIFKLVCFSRFQPGMVNPNIPVILINSIVIQEYANKNSGYQISIIIQNIPQQQAYTEQLLDIQNNQGQGIGDDFEKNKTNQNMRLMYALRG